MHIDTLDANIGVEIERINTNLGGLSISRDDDQFVVLNSNSPILDFGIEVHLADGECRHF